MIKNLSTAKFLTREQTLGVKWMRANGTIRDKTILEKHLFDYTRRNTFDYFIHKDLGGFLGCIPCLSSRMCAAKS